jgi:magnesium chelatase family protein
VLVLVREAKKRGYTEIYLPQENAAEAALVDSLKIFPVQSLEECIALATGIEKQSPHPKTKVGDGEVSIDVDFSDIKGQETGKRALEIAAAGGHNIALYGPPGTGKTMLAKAFRSLLPPLEFEEMLEITEIHSIAGTLNNNLMTDRPFRSPHHTSSYVSMVGGGATPKPGEITLSHRGVLFLDEFPEFDAKTIEAMRQPLEDKVVTVSRAKGTAKFPANFILVAAMNPCPCGNFGIKGKPCICSPRELARYRRKLSGPIIDRIDLWVEVSKIDYDQLSEKRKEESESLPVLKRIVGARKKQLERFKTAKTNGEMSAREIVMNIFLADQVKQILNESAKRFDISARGYHKLLKVARTIADLDNSTNIEVNHILEAISYRPKIVY